MSNLPKRGPALGRGLSALLGEAAVMSGHDEDGPSVSSSKMVRVLPITQLVPGKYQPRRRFDPAALAALADSIKQQGVLQPLIVRPIEEGLYEIVAGERRWRASQQAALADVPVIIREMDDRLALEIALVENVQRQDLNAIEEAEGYQRLLQEFQYTQEKLASSVGKSRSHVTNTLRLLGLPEKVRDYVEEGKISAGHARALLSLPNPLEAADLVIQKGLNVRMVELMARQKKDSTTNQKNVDKPHLDADTLALAKELSDHLGLKVSLTPKAQGGVLTLEFSTFDQLDSVLTRLRR